MLNLWLIQLNCFIALISWISIAKNHPAIHYNHFSARTLISNAKKKIDRRKHTQALLLEMIRSFCIPITHKKKKKRVNYLRYNAGSIYIYIKNSNFPNIEYLFMTIKTLKFNYLRLHLISIIIETKTELH